MENNSKESFQEVLEYIRMYRLKNRLKRDLEHNNRKIRDNRKRALLLENLDQYITDDMTIEEIREIIENMRNDYESRVDDYNIRNAELSQQRREIREKIKQQKEAHKLMLKHAHK